MNSYATSGLSLEGIDPLLYAVKKAIGPLQLTDDEVRTTARWAYDNNSRSTSVKIGRAIGRSRQAVDAYISDLRAAKEMDTDIKIFSMHRLGIPQERIAKCLGVVQVSIHYHLSKMPELAILINAVLKRGFTVGIWGLTTVTS